MKAAILPVLLVLPLLLAGCGEREPVDVSPQTLVNMEHEYDGRTVRTRGVVRGFDDPRHFWIEDEEYNRVQLFPEEWIEDRVGETVEVTGRFSRAEDRGRRIDMEAVRAVSDETME